MPGHLSALPHRERHAHMKMRLWSTQLFASA
jgi:hypothetical protein